MRKSIVGALLMVMLLSSNSVLAWGRWAHSFIAYVAEQHLTPEAKALTNKYLGSSIIDHSSWMDDVRKPVRNPKHPEHAYYMGWEHTLAWHMVTADKDLKLSDKRAWNNDGDLVPNLKVCIENLRNHRNLTDSAVVVNLKCVIHMVEDMHCPSHVYYTEFPDCFRKPGEKYRYDLFAVKYEGRPTTYHSVWDGLSILEIYPEYGKEFEPFRKKIDRKSPKQMAKMCEGTIEDWALETARDCRVIYEWKRPDDDVDRKFLLKHQDLTKQQCLRSAYRLAHVLNECLK